jgi:IclR helix-turn-helix domain
MPASVRKAALVLDLFSVERPDWGPTEVADELGIARPTAHVLLGELASVGPTERLRCGRYRLGWRTVGVARTMLATNGYRDVVMPTARRLAGHFGETVQVTAWGRGRVLYVASERPPGGVAAPAEPVAAELTPPGTVLPAVGAGTPALGSTPRSPSACAAAGMRSGPSALSIGWTAPPPRYAWPQVGSRRPTACCSAIRHRG